MAKKKAVPAAPEKVVTPFDMDVVGASVWLADAREVQAVYRRGEPVSPGELKRLVDGAIVLLGPLWS